jgi:hypothetical protein
MEGLLTLWRLKPRLGTSPNAQKNATGLSGWVSDPFKAI